MTKPDEDKPKLDPLVDKLSKDTLKPLPFWVVLPASIILGFSIATALHDEQMLSQGAALTFSFVASFLIFVALRGKSQLIDIIAVVKKFIRSIQDMFKAADKKIEIKKEIESEEQAYQSAAEEIENNTYRKGIWAKAFAEAEGVEHRQKALYIKYRAKQLMEEDK